MDEQDYSGSPNNILLLGPGIDPSQVTGTGDDQGDLVLRVGGSGGQITLDGQLAGYYSGVQQVQFANGTIWSAAQLATLALVSTPGADRLYGSGGADLIDGQGGGDYEQGNGGADTFVFNQGYGQLEVNETSYGQASLQFGPGIAPDEVQVKADAAGDMILTFANDPGDMVKIDQMLVDYYGQTPYGIGQVTFSDGTSWSYDQLVQQELASASSGNDTLIGDPNAHVIDGRGGNDYEQGAGGADTLVFNQGYGTLELSEDSGLYFVATQAVLKLGAGITSDQIIVSSDQSGDVLLGVRGSGDQIKIDKMLAPNPYQGGNNQEYGIKAVQFADGTAWDRAHILALAGH